MKNRQLKKRNYGKKESNKDESDLVKERNKREESEANKNRKEISEKE